MSKSSEFSGVNRNNVYTFRSATDCRMLCGHSGPVYGIHFSHDKKFLASASEDGTSKLPVN